MYSYILFNINNHKEEIMKDLNLKIRLEDKLSELMKQKYGEFETVLRTGLKVEKGEPLDEEWVVVNKPIGHGPTISSYDNEPVMGFVGAGIDLQKRIERAAKELGISVITSKELGISIITLGGALEQFAQSTKISEVNINDFQKVFNEIKPIITEQPKSKYINKPQFNYKKR